MQSGMHRLKSKPEVEFQCGGRPFFENHCVLYTWTWVDKSTKWLG